MGTSGSPMVSVTLNNVGARSMQAFTNENVGNSMAVVFIERVPEVNVVDGKEVRSVRVREEALAPTRIAGVFGKNFQTTGLERKEAEDLSRLLRAIDATLPDRTLYPEATDDWDAARFREFVLARCRPGVVTTS